MKSKVCNKCLIDKPHSQYFKAAQTYDGIQTICKACKAANRIGAKTNEKVLRDTADLPGERWKDIEGFEGIYMISSLGRVKSLDRLIPDAKPLSGFREIKAAILRVTYSSSYPTVRLTKDCKSKNYSIHILMWDAFGSEKRDDKRVVDHINNNKNDFRLENLQLISIRHNTTKDRKHKNLLGAIFIKDTGSWAARIRYNGKKIELGVFKSELEAHNRYTAAYKAIESGTFTPPKIRRPKTNNITLPISF